MIFIRILISINTFDCKNKSKFSYFHILIFYSNITVNKNTKNNELCNNMNYISEKLLLVALFFNIYNYIHKRSIGQIMDTTHRIHNILFMCNTAQYVTS